MADYKAILLIIKDFLQPVPKLEQTNRADISFESIITSLIEQFNSKHGEFSTQDSDPLWQFGLIAVRLLEALDCSSVNEPPACLSIIQEKDVSTLCELIISFGLHYNLEEDVGVPIDRLSKYGANLRLKRQVIDARTRNTRLDQVLAALWQIKTAKRKPDLNLINRYFYRKSLHTIVCGLVQLVYSPNSDLVNRAHFKKWLEQDLFEEVDGASIVSSIMMAQGLTQKHTWFTLQIGQMFTKCLLRPNSVMSFVRAILTDIGAVSSGSVDLASDWRKCDVVARVLVQFPKDMAPADYLKFIAPQWFDLMFKFDLKYSRHFQRVAGSLFSLLARRWPQPTFEYFTKPVIEPLIGSTTISGVEFRETLLRLHALFVESTEPNWLTLSQIPLEIVQLLFQTYENVSRLIIVTEIRPLLEDILKLYVKMKPSEELPKFFADHLVDGILRKKFDLNFDGFSQENSESLNHIVISRKLQKNCNVESVTIEQVNKSCSDLVKFLKLVGDENLETEFMLYILNRFADSIEENRSAQRVETKSANDQTLLKLENELETKSTSINLKIIFSSLLENLFSSVDPQQIVAKHDRVLDFCSRVLKTITEESETSDQPITQENLHLTLSLVSVFTTGLVELDLNLKERLRTFMPLLERIKRDFVGTEVGEMAESLFISVGTNCAIKTTEPSDRKSKLIQEISEQIDDYDRALNDVKDPLVPVKAHGLVNLRRLIDSRDERCAANMDELIELFMKYLKHEDSYVYLAAINCLISVVDHDPVHRILDSLLGEYTLRAADSKLDVETRLKVGEVLTKTVRNFGQLVPHYGPKLVSAFLVGCKHPEDLCRASSLSNLGETCKLLNYSLHDNINEIILCLSSLLDTDSSIEVKRSASMVLKMIVEGLNKRTFVQVLGTAITNLFKLLCQVRSTTQDDVIRLNCQLTSDYLNEMMRESMFPKQTLQKEIKILNP